MEKLFIVLFSLFLISGCKIKDAEEPVTETPPKETGVNNTLKQTLYKGMYSYSENSGRFSECGSGKKFILSHVGASSSRTGSRSPRRSATPRSSSRCATTARATRCSACTGRASRAPACRS